MSRSVCLSVRTYAYLRNHTSSVRATGLRLRLCPPLAALHYVMYFRFVNGVVFSSYRPYDDCVIVTLPQQPRCNAVHGLTPLLRGIGYVLSCTYR